MLIYLCLISNLSICLCTNISIYLSAYLNINLFICINIMYICRLIYIFICLLIDPLIIYLFVYKYMHLSFYLPISNIPIYPSTYLAIYFFSRYILHTEYLAILLSFLVNTQSSCITILYRRKNQNK